MYLRSGRSSSFCRVGAIRSAQHILNDRIGSRWYICNDLPDLPVDDISDISLDDLFYLFVDDISDISNLSADDMSDGWGF